MSRAGRPLASRLRRAFAVLVVLLALVGGSGVVAVSVSSSRVESLSRVLTPAVEANSSALQLMVDAETAVRGYLLTGDRTFLEPYAQAGNEVLGLLSRVETLAGQAGVSIDAAAEQEAARAWLEGYAAPVIAAGPDGEPPSTLHGKESFDRFREQQALVATTLGQERERVRAESRLVRTAAPPVLAALTVVFLIVAALTARGAVQTVGEPLARLRDVLERLRMGEHAARVTVEGPAEIRAVAQATNELADESDRLRAEQQTAARMRQVARDASRTVRDELDRDSVLATAAKVLGFALELDRVWVRYLDEGIEPGTHDSTDQPPRFSVQAQWHRPGLQDLAGIPEPAPAALAYVRRLARAGEVLAVPNVVVGGLSASAEGRQLLSAAPDAGALVVAPVEGNDALIGVVVLVTRHPRDWGEDELRAVQAVCADLGRALEHSRLYEQQLELVDRLQQLDRQKTDFLSTVSHELRTPLTAIAGYVEMVRDGDAGPLGRQQDGMLEVVERNTRRLGGLIEDLLVLSRIESGAFWTTSVPVALPGVVESVVQDLRPQAAAAGVELRARLQDGDLVVQADQAQLERVALNLAGNAVKFTPAGGRVDVALAAEPGWAVLTVTDTGIGIPEADQELLGSRFFRASNAVQAAVPGTGLGLSIVRGIVEHHGGRLLLRSAPGCGTEVTVRLPVAGPEGERVGEQVGAG